MSDRTVHAESKGGYRVVVRYDRAGKWYVEHPGAMIPAMRVTLQEAAYEAVSMERNGGRLFLKLPGGGRFDAAVRALREGQG